MPQVPDWPEQAYWREEVQTCFSAEKPITLVHMHPRWEEAALAAKQRQIDRGLYPIFVKYTGGDRG